MLSSAHASCSLNMRSIAAVGFDMDYTLGGCCRRALPYQGAGPSAEAPRRLPASLCMVHIVNMHSSACPSLPRAAQYKPDTFEGLAHRQTVDKLVKAFGYPAVSRTCKLQHGH